MTWKDRVKLSREYTLCIIKGVWPYIVIGILLYFNAAGVIPLVSVLTEKGVSMGTTLAFMMAVTGLSLP